MMLHKGDEPIPGHRLERMLGQGSYGKVWKATAPGGAAVALKIIDLSGRPGVKELRGLQRMHQIRHAHLVPIYALWGLDAEGNLVGQLDPDVFHADDARATLSVEAFNQECPRYLVVAMSLAEKSLLDRLRECLEEGKQGIPVFELLDYMEQAARGIDYLNSPRHDLGEGPVAVQHCDIKPANLLLAGDSLLICDYALAWMVRDNQVTATSVGGTLAYISPEGLEKKPGPGTDQYSLAVTYFELRTGHLPFEEPMSLISMMEAHRKGELDFSRLAPLERAVIKRATSLNPKDRYPTCGDMVRALRRAVEQQERQTPLRPWLIAASLVVAITLIASASIWGGSVWEWWRTPAEITILPNNGTNVAHGAENGKTNGKTNGDANGATHGTAKDETKDGAKDATNGDALNDAATDDSDRVPDDPTNGAKKKDDAAQATSGVPDSGDGSNVAPPAGEDFPPSSNDSQAPETAEPQKEKPPTPAELAEQAEKALEADDLDEAVRLMTRAIQAGYKAGDPQPAQVLHGFASGETKTIDRLTISPDGRWLLAMGEHPAAWLWDLQAPDQPPTPLDGHATVSSMACSGDSRYVLTGDLGGSARLWDLENLEAGSRRLNQEEAGVECVAFSPTGRWAAAGGMDGKIRLWEVAAPERDSDPVALEGHDFNVEQLIFDPTRDAKYLFSLDGTVVLRWQLSADRQSLAEAQPWEVLKANNSVIAASTGGVLANGDRHGQLKFFSFAGELLDTAQTTYEDEIDALAASRDGRSFASGDASGGAFLWQVSSAGKVTRVTLAPHQAATAAVAFSGDGRWLATGSLDKNVHLYLLDNEKTLGPLTLANRDRVFSVVFAPDSRFLGTAGDDGLVRQWDLWRCEMLLRAGAPSRAQANDDLRL